MTYIRFKEFTKEFDAFFQFWRGLEPGLRHSMNLKKIIFCGLHFPGVGDPHEVVGSTPRRSPFHMTSLEIGERMLAAATGSILTAISSPSDNVSQ